VTEDEPTDALEESLPDFGFNREVRKSLNPTHPRRRRRGGGNCDEA